MIITPTMAAALVCAALVSGCAHTSLVTENPPASETHAAMLPEFTVGLTQYQEDPGTGEQSSWVIQSIADNGDISALSSNGCAWSVSAEWFTQALSWKNCGSNPKWNSGTREILSVEGELWPLEVGNKATYIYKVINKAGEIRTEKDHCQVKNASRIDVKLGESDVFKVQCVRRDRYSAQTRTWHWSPEHGEISFNRVDSKKGVQRNVQVSRIARAF